MGTDRPIRTNKLIIGLCICAFIVVTVLLLQFIVSSFKLSKEGAYTQATTIFDNVIKKDCDIRLSPYPSIHQTIQSSNQDSITIKTSEGKTSVKKEHTDSIAKLTSAYKNFVGTQYFLIKNNPIKVSILDSMFQAELRQKGIVAQTAITYRGWFDEKQQKKKLIHNDASNPDSTFYQTAQALPLVTLAIPNYSSFKIELQGYVKYPASYLLGKVPYFYPALIIYAIIVFSLLSFIFWNIKKKKYTEVSPESVVSPDSDLLSNETSEEYIEKGDTDIDITEEVFIRNNGEIIYKGKMVCQLRELRLKLFLFLLQGPNYFQTIEDIRNTVWENSGASNETINKTIGRLRNDLKLIPYPLTVINIHGTGYQLIAGFTKSPSYLNSQTGYRRLMLK